MTTKTRSKKAPPPAYRATPAPKDPSPELLGGPPTPAQSGTEKALASRKGHSVSSVEIPVKATKGAKVRSLKRKAESAEVELEMETEENASSSRRSGRQPPWSLSSLLCLDGQAGRQRRDDRVARRGKFWTISALGARLLWLV